MIRAQRIREMHAAGASRETILEATGATRQAYRDAIGRKRPLRGRPRKPTDADKLRADLAALVDQWSRAHAIWQSEHESTPLPEAAIALDRGLCALLNQLEVLCDK